MYQKPASSSSSSLQDHAVLDGLTRLGSAPGAFLAREADAVIRGDLEYTDLLGSSSCGGGGGGGGGGGYHYFSRDSTCDDHNPSKDGLQRSSGLHQIAYDAGSLVRQRSSPAGFLNSHLVPENGFTITTGSGDYNFRNGNSGGHTESRLKSEMKGSLSHSGHKSGNHARPSASFLMESCDNTNSIAFTRPPSKQAKTSNGDSHNCLNTLEIQYSLPQTSFEMAAMDKLLNIPEDSMPCKIRAKRGCATHPRSIAERERRGRITERLKKLQQLAPNMDKQTNYADMLDLAVQHISDLKNEVQKLRKELENCKCGCK